MNDQDRIALVRASGETYARKRAEFGHAQLSPESLGNTAALQLRHDGHYPKEEFKRQFIDSYNETWAEIGRGRGVRRLAPTLDVGSVGDRPMLATVGRVGMTRAEEDASQVESARTKRLNDYHEALVPMKLGEVDDIVYESTDERFEALTGRPAPLAPPPRATKRERDAALREVAITMEF